MPQYSLLEGGLVPDRCHLLITPCNEPGAVVGSGLWNSHNHSSGAIVIPLNRWEG